MNLWRGIRMDLWRGILVLALLVSASWVAYSATQEEDGTAVDLVALLGWGLLSVLAGGVVRTRWIYLVTALPAVALFTWGVATAEGNYPLSYDNSLWAGALFLSLLLQFVLLVVGRGLHRRFSWRRASRARTAGQP